MLSLLIKQLLSGNPFTFDFLKANGKDAQFHIFGAINEEGIIEGGYVLGKFEYDSYDDEVDSGCGLDDGYVYFLGRRENGVISDVEVGSWYKIKDKFDDIILNLDACYDNYSGGELCRFFA